MFFPICFLKSALTMKKLTVLGKLTVMHLSYMNDPNEGKTLRQTVYGRSEQNSGKKTAQIL